MKKMIFNNLQTSLFQMYKTFFIWIIVLAPMALAPEIPSARAPYGQVYLTSAGGVLNF